MPPESTTKPHAILSIDDDPDMLPLFKRILGPEGFQVTGAHNGPDGLALIRSTLPDVVLLDIVLDDDMDGWEVYQRIFADELTCKIPAVIVTAIPKRVDRVLCTPAGPRPPYLLKPVTPHELIDAIHFVLQRSEDERKKHANPLPSIPWQNMRELHRNDGSDQS